MTEDATHLGYGAVGKARFFLIPAALGAGLGLAPQSLLGWLLGLPWLPFPGPLKLLDSIPDQIALPVLMGLGVVSGVVAAGVVVVRDQGGQRYWRPAGGADQLER